MMDRDELLAELSEAGVLTAIRWAYLSATDRVLSDYSAPAGYDLAWVGYSRFTLLCDRMDRVFSCRDYALPENSDGQLSLDVLYAELSDRDLETFPIINPGSVLRADLNGSSGWMFNGLRWLLSSGPHGDLDKVPWLEKSPTKQSVAQQVRADMNQPALFEYSFTQTDTADKYGTPELDMPTLVVAHSLDPDLGDSELIIGQPRLNPGGGSAWYWKYDLLQLPPTTGGGRVPTVPLQPDPGTTPDAPVRLRQPTDRHREKGVGDHSEGS